MASVLPPTDLPRLHAQARAQRDGGDPTGARTTLENALDWARTQYGEDHPDVLTTAHLLAQLHRDADDPATARRVLEEAVAAGQLRLGDEHPIMLGLAYDLGLVAEELGNRHEARRNLGLVATAGPAVLGDTDARIRHARTYLDGMHPGPLAGSYPRTPEAPRTATVPPARAAAIPRPTPVSQQRRSRRPLLAAAAVLLVAVAATAAGVALTRNTSEPPAATTPPTTPAAKRTDPPTQLTLTENGSAVTLTWADPTDGQVSFLVAGGRSGEQLTAMARLNPGDTQHELLGLNPTLNYCFRVVAVYGTDTLTPSAEVCTRRRPQPSSTGR